MLKLKPRISELKEICMQEDLDMLNSRTCLTLTLPSSNAVQ